MGQMAIHHICIQTNVYAESLAFYTNVLPFMLVQEEPNFHGRAYNTWLQLGHFYIELQTAKHGEQLQSASERGEGIVHFCLWVEDLQAEVERIKTCGAQFKLKDGVEIYEVAGGQLCKIIAPEGTVIELRTNIGF